MAAIKGGAALLAALLFLLISASAQPLERQEIPFEINGQMLDFPLAGGLNSPQFSGVDLNADGLTDLFIFDRAGDVILPFLSDGTDYRYIPETAGVFPEMTNWVLLRDFNADGVTDIFTYSDVPGVDGIRVFVGAFSGGQLGFERLSLEGPGDLIYYRLPSGGRVPLFVSRIDYPAVDDIDCDGDLDILTFNAAGGFVEFYQNQSVERGYGLDSLIFTLADDCWGGFFESGITKEVDLADRPGSCVDELRENPGVVVRHAGSTLLTLDADGDEDRDLILGDLSFTNLNLLTNGGDCGQAWMNAQETDFPADTRPVDLPFFPAAFYLDLNHDGVKDLVASPNAARDAENKRVSWFYENLGTDDSPVWSFRREDFLTDRMIDLGAGAHPAFFDYNRDGLMDLLVGNGFQFVSPGERQAGLYLFENVGSPGQPQYRLVDPDYQGMSRFNPDGYQFSPALGDLDGDGDPDLVVGEELGGLYYAENRAGPGNPADFGPWQYPFQEINVGIGSAPALADLNRDGRLDLVVGERNGNLNYFQNQGAPGAPRFDPDPEAAPNTFFLGEVDTRVPGSLVGYSAPVFFYQDQKLQLVTGTDRGRLEWYEDLEGNLYNSFTAADPDFGTVREGVRTRPALADVDADGLLELALGNGRGGLAIFQTGFRAENSVSVDDLSPDIRLDLFPNPADEFLIVAPSLPAGVGEVTLRLYDNLGRAVYSARMEGVRHRLPTAGLLPGFYYLALVTSDGLVTEKVIIRRD